MDQEATGRFIAQLRKENNLTQKELADKLGVSDKTVSKWETGNGIPDVSLLQPLCEILSVNLNELLSGEKLSDESYNGKAEENMMMLAKDAQDSEKNRKKAGILQFVLGIMVLFIGIWFAIVSAAGYGGVGGYYDATTMIILVIFTMGMIMVSGRLNAICKAIRISIHNGEKCSDEEKTVARRDIMFLMIVILISSIISILIGTINFLMNTSDLKFIGPALSVTLVSVLYSFCIDAFLFSLRERIQ